MTKLNKAILISLTILLAIGGLLFYQVNKVINVEQIRESFVQNLENNFPGSKVTLGEITYDVSTRVTIRVKDFSWTSSTHKLLEIKKIKFQFNLSSLINPKGKTTIELHSPSVQVDSEVWSAVYPKSDMSMTVSKVEIPHFLISNGLNLSLMSPRMVNQDELVDSLAVKKISFKNIKKDQNTAFEVQFGTLKLPYSKGDSVVNARLVGDIDLKSIFAKRTALATGTAFFRTQDKGLNNTIQSDFNFKGDTKNYQIFLRFKGNEKLSGDLILLRGSDKLSVKTGQLIVSAKSFLSQNWGKKEIFLDVNSDLELDLKTDQIEGTLKGATQDDVSHSWLGLKADTSLSFDWSKQGLTLSSTSKIANGMIQTQSKSKVNMSQLLDQKRLAENLIWQAWIKAEGVHLESESLKQIRVEEFIPIWLQASSNSGEVEFQGKRMYLDEQEFSIDCPYEFKGNSILAASVKVKSGQGSVFYSWLKDGKHKLNASEFDLNMINSVFPKKYRVFEGGLSGKGNWKILNGKVVKGSLSFEILRGRWIKGALHQEVLKSYAEEKKLDLRGTPNNFDQLNLRASMVGRQLTIKSLKYSLFNNYNFLLNGNVETETDQSQMNGKLDLKGKKKLTIDFLLTKLFQPEVLIQGAK